MRWYRGDLHAHSTFSDGVDSLDLVLQRVRENGLEFFALTEHKTVEHLAHLPSDSGLTLIPAFEFGDALGHANLFGITKLLTQNRSQEPDTTRLSLLEARRAGAYIAINHPFHYESTWRLPLEGIDYDWIELWNGPWYNSNPLCLQWWQQELQKGNKIPVAGGSDCHGNGPFHYYGQPTTWVRAPSAASRDILESLRHGHAVMSYSPEGPFIDLTCQEAVVGDEVQAGLPFSVEVTGLVKSDVVRLITDRGVEREMTADGSVYRESLTLPGRAFVRTEVSRYYPEYMAYQMAALTNPLYFRSP